MVRKWSYLTDTSLLINDCENCRTSIRHRFKVFRTTTRFKKYTMGMTKIVRKKYVKRKRRTLSYSIAYPSFFWAKTYIRLRQFWRCYQAVGVFTFTSYSADNIVFIVQKPKIQNLDGVNTFSCSKGIFAFHKSRQFSSNFIDTPFLEGQFAGVATTTEPLLAKTVESGNSLMLDNATNQLFPLNPTKEASKGPMSNELLSTLNNLPLRPSLSIVSCVRQILITSTIINSFTRR